MKKNIRRAWALLLALVMCLATSVLAAEPTIIDYGRKGSLTVHKYAEDDFYDSTDYLTQEEMEDYISGLGETVTPLADVTFRYLKVGDVKQYTKDVMDQTTGTTNNVIKIGYSLESELVSLMGLTESDIDMTVEGVNYYSVSTLDRALNTVSATQIERYINSQAGHVDMAPTNEQGISTATDLDLGLYLLVEYSYQGNTVGNEQHGHSVPSLVPLPLTDSTEDGTYSWNYDVNVYPKNIVEDITIDKVIVGNDYNETKEWDTEINSTVEYLIRADVPHGIGKLQTYTINDRLSAGIDYDDNSYSVYGVASNGVRSLLTAGTNFTFTNTDTHNMTWAFDTSTLCNDEDWAIYDSIEIRYTATPNKDAVVGNNGNDNYCELKVSHTTNTDTSSNPESVDTYVPTELPKVFTYALDLTKYGDSDSTNPLEDVTFELQDADGNPISVSEQEDGVKGAYYFDPMGTDTLTTDADGKLYIKGFQADTYYLKETSTNNGYSLLADKIEITITSNENTYTADDSGTYAPVDTSERYYTDETFADVVGTDNAIPGTDTVEDAFNWFTLPSVINQPDTLVPDNTYVCFNTNNVHTADGTKVQMYVQNPLSWEANFNMGDRDGESDTGVVSIVINDQVIFELPHTGGIGKYVMIGGGLTALCVAMALMVIERKRSNGK